MEPRLEEVNGGGRQRMDDGHHHKTRHWNEASLPVCTPYARLHLINICLAVYFPIWCLNKCIQPMVTHTHTSLLKTVTFPVTFGRLRLL